MPDISMCQNQQCSSKLKCYRFMAIPNYYGQSYAKFILEEGANKCDYFDDIKNYSKNRIRDNESK